MHPIADAAPPAQPPSRPHGLRRACALATLCSAFAMPALAQVAEAFAVATPAGLSPDGFHGESLQLTTGRQHTLTPGGGVERIAVGDPEILDVNVLRTTPGGRADAAQLLLTPKAAGSTTLAVWPRGKGEPQHWLVQVRAPGLVLERRLQSLPEHAQALDALRLHGPAEAALSDRSVVDVRSNTVQVDVQVVEFKKSAMKRAGINILSGGANQHGFSFGLLSPGANGNASFNLGNSSASQLGRHSSGSFAGQLNYQGSAMRSNAVEDFARGASRDITNNSVVESGMSASIVSAMNLVLGFGNAFGGAGIGAQLGFLESNGLARVLARPTLLAHTGQSASFLAGGELPIPVPSQDGNIGIEYKEFGIKLQLTPTVLSNQRIALKVAPEASDLDFTNAVAVSGVAVPAIRTRRADTMVELGDGESFVIGGLVSRTTTSNVNKVPLLGDLPVLGTFFKNLSYSQDETELAIVVTPHLVHPLPAGTDLDALLPGARHEHRHAAGVWESHLAGALKPDAALPGFSY